MFRIQLDLHDSTGRESAVNDVTNVAVEQSNCILQSVSVTVTADERNSQDLGRCHVTDVSNVYIILITKHTVGLL